MKFTFFIKFNFINILQQMKNGIDGMLMKVHMCLLCFYGVFKTFYQKKYISKLHLDNLYIFM